MANIYTDDEFCVDDYLSEEAIKAAGAKEDSVLGVEAIPVDPDVPVYDLADCTFSAHYDDDHEGMKTAIWVQGGQLLWDEFIRVREMYGDRFKADGYEKAPAKRRAWLLAYADIMGEDWPCINWKGPQIEKVGQPGASRRKKTAEKTGGFVDERIQALADGARGRRATQAIIRAWAFANIATPWSDLVDKDVPHPGAPAYLVWLKTEKGQAVFFTELTKAGRASLEDPQSDEEVQNEALDKLSDELQAGLGEEVAGD